MREPSTAEDRARMADLAGVGHTPRQMGATGQAELLDPPPSEDKQTLAGQVDLNLDFDVNPAEPGHLTNDALFIGNKALPPLPLKMTPSQAARLAEILDYLHQGLTQSTEQIQAKEDGTQVTLDYHDWQKLLAVQMLLARYLRMVADPPELDK